MPMDAEEYGKPCPSKETPDEVSDTSRSDTSVPSTTEDISERPTITETSEVARNVNSRETLPSAEMYESTAPSEGYHKRETAKSHAEEEIKFLSTEGALACNSETMALCEAAAATPSPKSSFTRKQRLGDTTEPNQIAVPSDVTGVINNAFEPDDTAHAKDDVQIHMTSSKTSAAQCRQVKTEWDVFKSRVLVGNLVALILWAAIFFPLLLNGII